MSTSSPLKSTDCCSDDGRLNVLIYSYAVARSRSGFVIKTNIAHVICMQ